MNFAHMSDQSDKIIPALITLQKAVQNPRRTTTNAVSMSQYAPLDEVLAMAKPQIAESSMACIHYKMLVTVPAASGEGEVVREALVTQLLHESGQYVQTFTILRPGHPSPQAMASAETLARRYNIRCLLNIADTDDDDDGNAAEVHEAPDAASVHEGDGVIAEAHEHVLPVQPAAGHSQAFRAFTATFDKLANEGKEELLRAYIKERLKSKTEIEQATKMVDRHFQRTATTT